MTKKAERCERETAEFLEEIAKGDPATFSEPFVASICDTITWVQEFRGRCLPEETSAWFQQMQRCLGSVYANSVEGEARGTRLNVLNFLRMARGSMYEAVAWATISGEGDLIALTKRAASEFDAYAARVLSEPRRMQNPCQDP